MVEKKTCVECDIYDYVLLQKGNCVYENAVNVVLEVVRWKCGNERRRRAKSPTNFDIINEGITDIPTNVKTLEVIPIGANIYIFFINIYIIKFNCIKNNAIYRHK